MQLQRFSFGVDVWGAMNIYQSNMKLLFLS